MWADGSREKCIFWLNGMAGTGKSTIGPVALSAGQGPTLISVGIHHNQPEQTAVACFGSKRPAADVVRIAR
jgi:hypothetical protein